MEYRSWQPTVEPSRSTPRGNGSGAGTHPKDPRVADERLLPVIERAFLGHKGETNPTPKDGGQWIRSFVYPIKDPGGLVRNVIVMHEDVTEEKRAEDAARAVTAELSQVKHAVLQQERLRALGQMAGGIAHDINNAISPAAMYVEALLEQDQTLNARARERLSIVQQAIAAVVQTVARLREFCRPREVSSGARGRGSQRLWSSNPSR